MLGPTSVREAASVAFVPWSSTAGSRSFCSSAWPSGLGRSGSCDSASALGFGLDLFRDPMRRTRLWIHRLRVIARTSSPGRLLLDDNARRFARCHRPNKRSKARH